MTVKQPTPMPEGISRQRAAVAPPKLHSIVTVNVDIVKETKYPVYCFDMWMWFDNQTAYLDWQDSLGYGKK